MCTCMSFYLPALNNPPLAHPPPSEKYLVLYNFQSMHHFCMTEPPRHAPRGYSGPAGGADKSGVEMLPRQSRLCGQSVGNYRGHLQQAESGPVCIE